MNDNGFESYSLRRPPWSGNSVRPSVRVAAWFFLFCVAVVFAGAAVLLYIEGGIPREYWLLAFAITVAELYFAAVVAHVAVRGVAPTNWIPWT